MSAAPSPHDFDGRDRLARLEGNFAARCDREDAMHELHRKERAESEARVMAEVKASEDRTGKRIDGVVAAVGATNTKIDSLVTALTTGRSATPANTDDSDSGAGPVFKMSIGRVPPKVWALIIAALSGAGIVGGGLSKVLDGPQPAPVVNVTNSP